MKTKVNYLLGALAITFGLLVATTALPSEELNANNGTIVNMVKNAGWTIGGGCLPSTVEKSSSTQFKNGTLHLLQVHWDLSGTCVVPANGTATYTIGTPYGPADLKVNASGMAHMKIVVN